VSSAHGSTVDRPLNAKGYVIWAIHARSKGSGRVQAKGDGEHAGVRRRAAEGSPARPYLAAQDAKTCARGLYTKLRSTRASLGGQGGVAGIHGGRRRKGAGRPRRRARGAAKACKEVKNERGTLCSPCEEASGEHTGEEKAGVKEFDDGDGSGGAPVGGDSCSRRCATPVAVFPGQQASREGYDRVRGRKG
jgi:hypothetical protein